MSFNYFARFVSLVVLTSAAFGQQQSESQAGKGLPQRPRENTSVRSYPGGDIAGSKVVRTRSESAGREVITETVEVPGTTGKFETSVKTTTETTGIGSDTLKIKREVFGNGPQGPLSLIETSVADQQNFPDGRSRTTTNTWAPDAGGRLNLSSREVKETKSIGGDVRQTETTRYLPTINQPLGESERVLTTERRVRPDLVQTETQRTVRDPNGQWQTTETRNQEVRTDSRGEVVEEETVRNVDSAGQLNLSEKTVTRRTTNNGSDQVVTEVYSPYITGLVQSGNSLALNQRLRVTTKPTANGGSQIISETEAPDPSFINGPVRVVARTVETVRQVAPDVWETQRQTFTLDGSGRLVLTSEDRQQTKGK